MPKLSARAERILRQSIPGRLSELYGCARIIEAFEAEGDAPESADIALGGRVLKCSPVSPIILWPCLDAALMTCRTLLNLLGIGLNRAETDIRTYSKRKVPTDAWMTDFGLAPIPVDDACEGHAPLKDADVRRLLTLILYAANKGIGHLTDVSTRDIISEAEVAQACDIVITLVNRHIYKPRGKPDISFEAGSKYGHVNHDVVSRVAPGDRGVPRSH
jgi:hypothetical protein